MMMTFLSNLNPRRRDSADITKDGLLRINYALLEYFNRVRANYSFEDIDKMRANQIKKHACKEAVTP